MRPKNQCNLKIHLTDLPYEMVINPVVEICDLGILPTHFPRLLDNNFSRIEAIFAT